MTSESDVIIIGGGHNALVCAGYLAESGLAVTVLEARELLGGNTITEQLTLPGWNHDSCSSAHVVLQSNPLVRADELGLMARYGLEYIVTDPAVVVATDDHGLVVVPPDIERAAREFERFSAADGAALRQLATDWDAGLAAAHARYSSGLRPVAGEWSDRYEALRVRTAWDVVHELFEHPAVRQTMMWMAFATIQPPRRAGTGALPYSITMGRLRFGWATPVGGSGALPGALRAQIEDHGGSVLTDALVEQIVVAGGRATGVRTADGRTFTARRGIVSAAHLTTMPALLDGVATPALERAAATWQPGIALFAVHLAISADITYRGAHGPLAAVAGGIGTPEGLARQVDGAYAGRIETDDPWVLIVSSTVVDPDRAPGGVLKFLTVAPSTLDGREWTDADADAYASRLIELVARHVDGLDDASILAVRAESPASLARHNVSNIGGSCHGGEFAMPDGSVIPGWLDYRTEIDGLYLTGSTSHPGGSVSGRPGRNTARVVLDDLGLGAERVMSLP